MSVKTESALPAQSRMPKRLDLPADKPIPFSRLVSVEARKMLDTRAGRWLLIVIALVVVAISAIMLLVGEPGQDKAFVDFVQAAVQPTSMLLPILGVLMVTTEYTQRTGLVTYTLEPRRTRVGLAKLASALLIGAMFVVVAVLIAAAMTALTHAIRGGASPDWSMNTATWIGVFVGLLLVVAQGVGFGLALQNTPAAIVLLFFLPIVWTILGTSVQALENVSKWLDITQAMMPLYDGKVSGEQWGQLATSVGVWVLIPIVIGLWRVNRSEVK